MSRKTKFDDVLMYFNGTRITYWKSNDIEIDKKNINLSYYLDIKPRIMEGHFNLFDCNGIPLTRYDKDNIHINPVNISAFALGCLDMYIKDNDNSYLKKFYKMADWLCENQIEQGTMGVWYYNFDWKFMKKPWISGMAQGEALSTLSRAYDISKNIKYLECANKAFNCFLFNVEDGGIVSYLKNKYIFFEEYPSRGNNTFVLNGFIYALLGLMDYYIVSGNDNALELFQKGIETLVNNLSLFDTGYWSFYNYSGDNKMIASYMYHNLHIVQLKILYDITNENKIKEFYECWSFYAKSIKNRCKALMVKLQEKF